MMRTMLVYRHAQDVRQHYQHKLQRANNLYMELTACLLQLEKREQQLIRYYWTLSHDWQPIACSRFDPWFSHKWPLQPWTLIFPYLGVMISQLVVFNHRHRLWGGEWGRRECELP